MNQKWILILVFYMELTLGSEEKIIIENQDVDITCKPPEAGSMIVWFRVLDKSGMEFIASFSNTGIPKSSGSCYSYFSNSKISQSTLTLKSFDKTRDSGVYSCAAIKSNELKFGDMTRLVGEKDADPTKPPPAPTTTKPSLPTTTTACVCDNSHSQAETSPELLCNPLILGPLAGSCGLLLLLLIITTLYCNHVRTRRCPHHHNRKPRTQPPGKLMTNVHV
uniref:Ig-like domain-containing protein n=1 Tax=Monopterus albus TaxID=43700 RepID=A0A3Q3Q359_MONAL|nr:T-cell surface glycoprotein CD8 alpha chain [Monopterus albus]